MVSSDELLKPTGAILAEVDLSINAPKAVVWKALTEDIDKWWPKEFYASKTPAKFKVDLKLGGHMYEDAGANTGLIWFTILGIIPDEMLYVIGHTRPPFGGPASGLITFELKSTENNMTNLRVSDASFGHVTENMIETAKKGWTMIFTPMKEYVEAI